MEQVIAEKPYNSYSSHFEHNEAHSSGVSWSAVIAGAFVDGCLIAHSSRFGYRLRACPPCLPTLAPAFRRPLSENQQSFG